MSDTKGFVIVLEDDIGEEHRDAVLNTFRLMRGVVNVRPVEARGYDDVIIEDRVRHELEQKLRAALRSK